jgi:hypothetical protein
MDVRVMGSGQTGRGQDIKKQYDGQNTQSRRFHQLYFTIITYLFPLITAEWWLCSGFGTVDALTLWGTHLERIYEGAPTSFRTGRLERELQMVQLSATRCRRIAILWVSPVSFAAITLCVASQRVFIVVYFVIDTARKLLYTPSYIYNNFREKWIIQKNASQFQTA